LSRSAYLYQYFFK